MTPKNLFNIILKIFGLFFLREIVYLIPQLILTIPYLTNQDNFHFYIRLMIAGKMSKPFDGNTFKPKTANFELAQKIKEYYLLKHGKQRKLVDQKIMERLREL